MAVHVPFAGLVLMNRLVRLSTPGQRRLSNRIILVKLHKCLREIRTISTGSVKWTKGEEDGSDPAPPSTALTSRQALLSRRRRPLSPLERISGLLPQDALSPEVRQLREQNQQDTEQDPDTQLSVTSCAQEESGRGTISEKEDLEKLDTQLKETLQEVKSSTSPTLPGERLHVAGQNQQDTGQDTDTQVSVTNCAAEESGHGTIRDNEDSETLDAELKTLPGERLLVFGELLVAEYRRKGRVEFRKMFKLQAGARLQSSWGIILHDDIAGQPAGRFLRTSRGVPILTRRASLQDYVLFMKRGPAITYPKDAATMLMMMDVTEGDCVLESGSGSGAMSLFLSRAVGSKGRVLSVDIREDHLKRAAQNYSQWRTSWNLRRGEEWPDNVQFHNADLRTASPLLAGWGFHAVALDLINAHLVLPAVTPHLHPGAVCAVYVPNITQVIELLEGLRCLRYPLLCEHVIEVPIRDWMVAPALQKDGSHCVSKAPTQDEDKRVETLDETDTEETTPNQHPAFGSIPYIARPHPEQLSHTAFLVKLRKCVQ